MPSAKKKTKSKQKPKENYTVYFIHYTYCLAIIVLLIITSININKFLASQKVLGASTDATSLQNEKVYWQNIVTSNPTYIDGYLELAKVDVELGNKNEASDLIVKALQLDPNSEKITSAQQQLGL